MSTNAFYTGEFYTGEFVTEFPEFVFRDALRDQRQVVMVEISAQHQASLIAFSRVPTGPLGHAYFFVNTSGSLQSLFIDPGASAVTFPVYPTSQGHTWKHVTQAAPPKGLVMIDETGGFKALTPSAFTGAPTLTVVPTTDPSLAISQLQFVGPYLTMLGEDGHSVYRITVTSDNVIHVDLYQDEPERIQSITVQNGHPFLFFNGRTYKSQLLELGDVDVQVPQTDFGFGGLVTPRIGVVKISLADSKFDFLTHQDWEDRTLTYRLGSSDDIPEGYPLAIRAKTKSASWNEDAISIALRDNAILFDRPFLTEKYAGTGGLEGDAELEGQFKPRILGLVELYEPLRISQNQNIYQATVGAAHHIANVSQGGINLSFGGDTPNGLFSWVPSQTEVNQGKYRVDTTNGLMRTAAPPGGRVIIFSTIAPTVLPNRPSMAMLIRYVCQVGLPEIEIDDQSFNDFESYFPVDFPGIYLTEPITVGDLLTRLVESYGAVIGINRLGFIQLKPMQFSPPVAFIQANDIEEGNVIREQSPSPANEYKLAYRKRTKFTQSDFLLGNVDPYLSQSLIGDSFKTIGPLPPELANRYPVKKLKELTTNIQYFGQADIINDLLFQRDWALRDVYTITVQNHAWQFDVGDTVLWEYPRWGLDVPRAALVVGITERTPTFSTENRTTLRLWC